METAEGPTRSDLPRTRRKVSDVAAEQLELKIRSGEYPVGTKLAAEPALAKIFGVGRSSMREAVRTLSAAGYLRSAHGSGVFVVSDRPVNTAVNDRTLSGGYTMTDLLEARESIEARCAELAAARMSDHHREVIQSILAAAAPREVSQQVFVTLDAQFHRQIAEASSNPLLLDIWDSIAPQFTQYSFKVIDIPGRQRRAHLDHCDIAEAVFAGDSERAARLAREHVDAVRQELRALDAAVAVQLKGAP
ncbi:FadR/GntR family transcriptional regulator [Microbacterium sp. Marseille-Q6648]|uniref:FadR/GntR family transcriptional regulator n=1 Tax=Microbacterium sp. Marseille-Q6648 TaxID=2937991 RepID=UPI00203A64FD|nr:FadR/GntR family transcriptional regulator [Microbacterium sp. Marseille-Q6648]